MSGKDLPPNCAKDGPTVCAWQFPNVAMGLATDAKTYSQLWSSSPGLLDPFHVAYQCVRRLKGATFVNVKHRVGRETDKSQWCPGLQIYLTEIVQNEQANRDVKEHIAVGSSSNLTSVVQHYKSLSDVLLFLMKYLKERGPLMKFKYNTKQYLDSIVANPRFLLNVFKTSLCQFELEFQAAVTIGEYLNFLLFVAYAHDLYWIKDILADAWGPLLVDFVNVGTTTENLREREKQERVKLVAMQMIDAIPWASMKSAENFKITINPLAQMDAGQMTRKSSQEAKVLKQLTTRPPDQSTLLGDAKDGSRATNIVKLLGDLDMATEETADADAKSRSDSDSNADA